MSRGRGDAAPSQGRPGATSSCRGQGRTLPSSLQQSAVLESGLVASSLLSCAYSSHGKPIHPANRNLSVNKIPRCWGAGDGCLEPGPPPGRAGLGSELHADSTWHLTPGPCAYCVPAPFPV